jgi:ParB/RepB/Spo0J family partition protein
VIYLKIKGTHRAKKPGSIINNNKQRKAVKKMAAGEGITEDFKSSGKTLYLPCAKLVDHPLSMGFYAESHLKGLLSSIRESGLLEPIMVCPIENDEYYILSGHYRIRAVRRLKWKRVLCRVVVCDKRTAALIYCTSNLLSRGLSAIEEAHMISHLISEEKFTLLEIGRLWGRSKSWVSRRMALLVHLEPKLKKDLGTGHLSPRVAQELLRLPRGNEQEKVLSIIRKCHLNKDESAKLVDLWLNADEEEKRSLLETGFPKGDLVLPFGTEDKWGKTVAAYLLKTTQVITGIMELVDKKSDFLWWPMEAYEPFRDAVFCLDKTVNSKYAVGG